ncbi:hypothetical protein AGMMS50276_06810 [Synergistales bacterium]|nr:hypothetical protein AGMMS50276_06810 [Synergistales bacterium]
MQLPEYQEIVKGYYRELADLFAPYTKDGAQKGKYRPDFAAVLSKHADRIRDLDHSAKPHIMFYGIYNAGKSTLLNAIMGKEVAKVADVPTTYKTTSYTWNGYELLDTPGIGAPPEHERVANNELDQCHVIVFVVSSAGSFEDKQIYESMKYIIGKRKKLLIAMNDKTGLDMADSDGQKQIFDIQDKILKNLSEVGNAGGYSDILNKYKVIFVNGQDALEGRLNNDERLVICSNISELEVDILKEIKRVNGFGYLYNALRGLRDDVDLQATALFSESAKEKDGDLNDELRQINEEYWAFIKQGRNIVKQECAGLARAMLTIYPQEPSKDTDGSALSERVAEVQKSYQSRAIEVVRNDLEGIRANIALRFNKALDEMVAGTPDMSSHKDNVNLPDVEHPGEALSGGGYIEPSSSSASSPDFLGPTAKTLEGMGGTKIATTVIPKIITAVPALAPVLGPIVPIVAALPPLLPVVGVVLGVISLLKNIFGESEADKQNARIEEQARIQREYEERVEIARVAWRQNIREFCETNAEQFVSNLQSAVQKWIESTLKPLLEEGKNIFAAQKEELKTFQKLNNDYYALKDDIDATLEELQSQA